ncbi:MAG: ABC transporter ATP-binding protein [Neomegalonema sp.]|nr:ABC transporter ATP-binding protein [Neomegalonema sp.]
MQRAESAPQAAATSPHAPSLWLEQLHVRSKDGARLVGPVDLSLPGGRWTALLGRSGAGKSSILRAIAGLIHPEQLEGAIRCTDGAPLTGRIAWMAQDPLLAPWLTVKANVAMGDRLRGAPTRHQDAAEALAAVGLASYASRMPDALSGGERQRVALARTLYEDRAVALLDEPFSALDALTRDEVSALAAEKLAGRTVLHVTHDPFEAARLADKIVILSAKGDHLEEAELGPAGDLPAPRSPESETCFELAAKLRRRLAEMETTP